MSKFPEPVSGLTHLIGAILALTGLLWLITLTHHEPTKLIPVAIFGGSMVLVYCASSALHLRTINCSPCKEMWLTRLDHASIYILIAGTYTPVIYYVLNDDLRWEILISVWLLALIGVVYKLLFLRQDGVWSTLYYVALGCWGFILAGPQLFHGLPPQPLTLLIGGGLSYLVGAVVFALHRPNLHPLFGFHELWHLFVMAGSSLHFMAILHFIF
jgi:hemolysin III